VRDARDLLETRRSTVCRIGAVGDFQTGFEPHEAIPASIDHDADGTTVAVDWLPTDTIATPAADSLDSFDGQWMAPGSPYRSLDGALVAIRHARLGNVPLLGTCGGFQRVVLEYARNVLGFADARYAEYDPCASRLFITSLSCSLVGKTLEVHLEPGSHAAAAQGATDVPERYYCNFGLNPDHEQELVDGGLAITGRDSDGEPRVVELPDHDFFIATLYVPQTSSTSDAPHPLIGSFLAAAEMRQRSRP
jgi:CTP synthase (UTP-ammonia lyase)